MIKNILNTRKSFSEFILLISLVLLFLLSNTSSLLLGQTIFVVSVISNIQLFFKYRKIDIISIFLIFSLVHLIYIASYFFGDIPYHYITKTQTLHNTTTIFFIQFIVLRLFFIGINPNTFVIPRFSFKPVVNRYAFWFFIIFIIILIPLSTLGNDSIFSGDNSYSIESSSSIWLEYCIIFIVVAYLYADSKFKRNVLIIVSSFFILLPLSFGKRGYALMVSLTLFNLFWSGRIKQKYIYLSMIIMFVFIRLFAQIRVNRTLDFSFDSIVLGINGNTGIQSNGPGGVLVCCTTYLSLIETGVFDFWFSVKSFFGIFTGVFIPASFNLPETYVNREALKYESIPGNGGFPGIYLYIWGRYFGVFIGSLLFNSLLSYSQKNKNAAVYLIFVLSTFPRWFIYNFHGTIKMGIWLLIFIFFSQLLTKTKTKTN